MKLTKPLIGLTVACLAVGMAGCGNGGGGGTDTVPNYTSTVSQNAGADATQLDFWTFVELHGKFYETMAAKWNAANPDKQVKINVNVMPYDDMHNKLQLALNSGTGAPDICDVEVGKFANFTAGTPALVDLTAVAAPYASTIVPARMKLYQKDGKQYGLPTHVGTTLAFYNTDELKAADIDYTTIKTWDDFKAAGEKYYAATGKNFSTADTSAMWQENLLLGQEGSDWMTTDGTLQVNSDAVVQALSLLKDMEDAHVLATIAGGQPDTEEAYGEFNKGNYAVAIMPEWFMSRYTAYMPDLKGKIAIGPAPVIPGATVTTVGGGGTGTVIPSQGKNIDIASQFLAYAKLSTDGAIEIWNSLGFDPCNMSIWTDEAVTHDPNNEFNQYFENNVFDVLNTLKDSIGYLPSTTMQGMPNINNKIGTETLNEIFENGADIQATVDQAQSDLKNELGQS
jgi:arabinosaccharide transport system substrate-binding protein